MFENLFIVCMLPKLIVFVFVFFVCCMQKKVSTDCDVWIGVKKQYPTKVIKKYVLGLYAYFIEESDFSKVNEKLHELSFSFVIACKMLNVILFFFAFTCFAFSHSLESNDAILKANFNNVYESAIHINMKPGIYVIIPATYEVNAKGSLELNVYATDNSFEIKELTVINDIDSNPTNTVSKKLKKETKTMNKKGSKGKSGKKKQSVDFQNAKNTMNNMVSMFQNLE